MDFITKMTLLLPLAFNFHPAKPVEDPVCANHATALVKQIESDNPIKFSEYLESLKTNKVAVGNNSLLRVIDQSNRKDRSPIFIKMILDHLRSTRPDLEMEKYFHFSAGDTPFTKSSTTQQFPILDHSNWGPFTLEATQIVLDQIKGKVKDKSVNFSTTSDLKKSIKAIMADPQGQNKTALFFNYETEREKSLHTSLFYIEKNKSGCNAMFLDSVDFDEYKAYWGDVVSSGVLKDCKVRFVFSSRQMDQYSCASFCIHDFLNIQKREAKLFESLDELENMGMASGRISLNETECVVHQVLPPSFMALAQSSKHVIEPYIEDLETSLNSMPLASRGHSYFKNKLQKNTLKFSGKHLTSEEWEELWANYPSLAELYYDRGEDDSHPDQVGKTFNTKSKNVYSKYTSLILKHILTQSKKN